MGFNNFHTINHHSSSTCYFSSSSPLPYPNPIINRHHNDNYAHYSLTNHRFPPHSSHSPSYFTPFTIPHPPFPEGFDALEMRRRDMMQREIEKERIREEIIAEEIMRRRALEEEVRREIMIERDRFLRYGSTQIDSRVPLLTNFEETDRLHPGVSTWCDTRFEVSERLPFLRSPRVGGKRNGYRSSSGVSLKEIKSMDKEANKEKVIILAKPNVNSTDLKRKTTPPSGADPEVKSVPVKKQKTEDEWSCALCQITATSEQGLNEHLQGKKHLARERGLLTQKVGFGVSPKPKVPKKSAANDHQKNKMNEGAPKAKEPKKTPGNDHQKNKVNEGAPNPKANPNVDLTDLKRKTTPASGADLEFKSVPVKKQKTEVEWSCALCQIIVRNERELDAHLKGKKHLALKRGLVTQNVKVPSKTTASNPQQNKVNEGAPKLKLPKRTTANKRRKNKVKEGSKLSTKINENPAQKTPGTEEPVLDEQKSVEKSTKPEKLKFWCDICKVAAHTEKVMDSHTRGKRHLANLQKLNRPNDPVPEKISIDTNIEEKKDHDFASVVVKEETVAEAGIAVDIDLPPTDNEDKIVDNVADDGITKQDNEQELPPAMVADC